MKAVESNQVIPLLVLEINDELSFILDILNLDAYMQKSKYLS